MDYGVCGAGGDGNGMVFTLVKRRFLFFPWRKELLPWEKKIASAQRGFNLYKRGFTLVNERSWGGTGLSCNGERKMARD